MAETAVPDGGAAGAENPLHGGLPPRTDFAAWLIFWIAVAFSAFQVYTAAYTPLSSLVVRSIHVGFLLLLTYALCARMRRGAAGWADWALAGLAFAIGLYHWVFEEGIILRAGDPSTADLVVGAAAIALVFEAGRRLTGPALPIVCGLFLGYALFGEYLPSPLNHRGYGFDQVIDHLFLGTEGIYGVPTLVSATYIFLFILFGSFLERAGMINLFNDISLGLVGHQIGGPAKVAVISSALMGTINGSGVANVVTTGAFTIPLMKSFGYRKEFAGAVEATSSMGGQIMPPVMGAVAFIMAETLGVPYAAIVQAAIIPAILYFAACQWAVHLEASRLNLRGLPKDQCPSALGAIRQRWYLLLPLAVLVYLLFAGFTPMYAGTIGLALTALVVLGTGIALRLKGTAMRVLFWVALGLAAAALLEFGIGIVFALIAALVATLWFIRGGRKTLRLALESLADGAYNALGVGVACALVGVIVGTMTLTGAASNFVRVIVDVGQESMFLSLVLTMLSCLVLGMGIPTIPNYIITSSLAGPALEQLGVPLILSHMFVFYFGIMADLTPPVALAAFAAAPIAKASGFRIGFEAVRIALPGFVVPFMAIYDPALMLQNTDPVAVVYVTSKAVLAIGLWGVAFIGYLWAPQRLWERLLAFAAAAFLVVAVPWTDYVGFALAALYVGSQILRRRAAASIPAE